MNDREVRLIYYQLRLGLLSLEELWDWLERETRMLVFPPAWMSALAQAGDVPQAAAAMERQISPFAPMDYPSLLNGLLFGLKTGRFDLVGLEDRLKTLCELDPLDRIPLVNLSLRVSYIEDVYADSKCSLAEALNGVEQAFEQCLEDLCPGMQA